MQFSDEHKESADIGLIGLAVMGENLVLNLESRGLTVAVYNRTTSKVDNFIAGRGKGKKLIGCHSPQQLADALKKPRKVMMLVKAGKVVDIFIKQLEEVLSPGDVIIDGGNSHYDDSTRRTKELAEKGFLFIGSGVSGGEEGALKGPSLMPGGNAKAWPLVKDIFFSIAAKVEDGTPCCDWVGEEGAGHFVKMVHNGIEYGDMQLICEAYHILKHNAGLSNSEMAEVFREWNRGELDSYLIEITHQILDKRRDDGDGDGDSDGHVVDVILDRAGQKGTGKWTVIAAADMGMPLTLIGEAVFARCLSAQKDDRVKASSVLQGPSATSVPCADRAAFIEKVRQALFAAKLVSYAQGFVLIRAAAKEFGWTLDYGAIALMWRGGCIIRSKFLGQIKKAYDAEPGLDNLLLAPFFTDTVHRCQDAWRDVVVAGVRNGLPMPAITSALAYYDGLRCARLPANLLQAQRDFFGAHTYERVDRERGQFFHTNWTGRGGDTASSSYNA